jgi:hypothetical protein
MKANGERSDSITRPGDKLIVKADGKPSLTLEIKRVIDIKLGRLIADCVDENGKHYCAKVVTAHKLAARESAILSELKGIKGVSQLVYYGKVATNEVVLLDSHKGILLLFPTSGIAYLIDIFIET